MLHPNLPPFWGPNRLQRLEFGQMLPSQVGTRNAHFALWLIPLRSACHHLLLENSQLAHLLQSANSLQHSWVSGDIEPPDPVGRAVAGGTQVQLSCWHLHNGQMKILVKIKRWAHKRWKVIWNHYYTCFHIRNWKMSKTKSKIDT